MSISPIRPRIAELQPEVNESSLLDHMDNLKSNTIQYNQAFDSVVGNTKKIEQLRHTMTQAYETVTQLLAHKVKVPLEEKKNQALIIGDELSVYEMELLSLTDRLHTLMATTRLNENNFF